MIEILFNTFLKLEEKDALKVLKESSDKFHLSQLILVQSYKGTLEEGNKVKKLAEEIVMKIAKEDLELDTILSFIGHDIEPVSKLADRLLEKFPESSLNCNILKEFINSQNIKQSEVAARLMLLNGLF